MRVVAVVGVCAASAVRPPHAHIKSIFRITRQGRGIAVTSRPPVAAETISRTATAGGGGGNCLFIATTVVTAAVVTAVAVAIAGLGGQRQIGAADNTKSFAAHRLHSALIKRSGKG